MGGETEGEGESVRGVGREERGNKGDRQMGGETEREGESVRGVGKVPLRFKRFFIFYLCWRQPRGRLRKKGLIEFELSLTHLQPLEHQ